MNTDIWTVAWGATLPAWIVAALDKGEAEAGGATWDSAGDGMWINTATAGGVMVPMGDSVVRDRDGGLYAVSVPPGWMLVPAAEPYDRTVDEAALARLRENGAKAWAGYPGPVTMLAAADSEGGEL